MDTSITTHGPEAADVLVASTVVSMFLLILWTLFLIVVIWTLLGMVDRFVTAYEHSVDLPEHPQCPTPARRLILTVPMIPTAT